MALSKGNNVGPVVILEVQQNGAVCRVSDQIKAIKDKTVTASQLRSQSFSVPTIDLYPQLPRASEPCFFVQAPAADVTGTKGMIVSVNIEDEDVTRVAQDNEIADPLDLGLKDRPNGLLGDREGVDPTKVDYICRLRDLSEAGEVDIFNGGDVVRMLELP